MRYSVLDLAPVPEGSTTAQALANSADLAQHAERWGYDRYWLAEHHNMPGIASAATAVMIGHIAQATSTMRIGAGVSCCPITRLTWWQRPLAHWPRSMDQGSTLVWGARREPIWQRCVRCDAGCRTPGIGFRRTCRN